MLNYRFQIAVFVISIFLVFAPLGVLAQQRIVPSKLDKSLEDKQIIISAVMFEGLDSYDEFIEKDTEDNLYEDKIATILRENRIKLEEKAYNPADIEKAIGLIDEWLFNKGFMTPAITVFIRQNTDNPIVIIFSIKRGDKTRVSDVEFFGNKVFTHEQLKENVKQCLGDKNDTWKPFDKDFYKYCLRKYTMPFMQSRGYLKALIESPKMKLATESLTVNIRVNEGLRYRIGQISVNGAKEFSPQEILEMLGQKPDDVANLTLIRDFFYKKLKKLYEEKGFIQFDADVEVELNEPTQEGVDGTVDYAFEIQEGRAFKVSRIEFFGVDQASAKSLREAINIRDGQVFNKSAFEQNIEKINATNRFTFIDKDRDVEIRDDENGYVQIALKLQEIQ